MGIIYLFSSELNSKKNCKKIVKNGDKIMNDFVDNFVKGEKRRVDNKRSDFDFYQKVYTYKVKERELSIYNEIEKVGEGSFKATLMNCFYPFQYVSKYETDHATKMKRELKIKTKFFNVAEGKLDVPVKIQSGKWSESNPSKFIVKDCINSSIDFSDIEREYECTLHRSHGLFGLMKFESHIAVIEFSSKKAISQFLSEENRKIWTNNTAFIFKHTDRDKSETVKTKHGSTKYYPMIMHPSEFEFANDEYNHLNNVFIEFVEYYKPK